ncbi:MAG: hypothetical protein ABUL42_03075, partial [Terricaulis silvestris]
MSASTGCGAFEAILDALLPHGGVAVSLQAYMDESGTDDESPVLCVAGYVFRKKKAKQFCRRWERARV